MIKLTIIISILLILAVGYIGYDYVTDYLQEEISDSYFDGAEAGILQWNQDVINTVNDEGVLPYLILSNNTGEYLRQSIPLLNLCENFK